MWGCLCLLDFFNVKNVYFVQYGEFCEGGCWCVVFKCLGLQCELVQFDQSICKWVIGWLCCDLFQVMFCIEFVCFNGDVWLFMLEVVEGWLDLVYCFLQCLLDCLVCCYVEIKDLGSFLLCNFKDFECMQLLFILVFNFELLVLQSFLFDEGWLFVKYFGVCGRMVVVNYVGEELWSYFNVLWEKRVDFVWQLMEIVEQFINNDFEFVFYFLDVSFDNFVVGLRDGKVIIVDVENVLVVDKRLIR